MDRTDQGLPPNNPKTSAQPRAVLPKRWDSLDGQERMARVAEWLSALTTLWEVLPPLQQTTNEARESRLQTYVEELAPRWDEQRAVTAIKSGLLEWKFFPSIAEIEAQCKRFEPKAYLVDSGLYRKFDPKRLSPPSDGPKRADFAKLLEAIRTGTVQGLVERLKR